VAKGNKVKKEPLILAVGSLEDDDLPKLSSSLREEGLRVRQIEPVFLAFKIRSPFSPAVILFDIDKIKEEYLDIFKKLKKRYPSTPIIILSSIDPACMENTLRLLKEGAYDYLKKPLFIDELRILIRRALKERLYIKQGRASDCFLPSNFILGKSPKMRKVIHLAREVAPTDLTVLIRGESGTGKDVLASIIHQLSGRKGKPFLRLNCAALAESIMESELFGYEKGAFTGAEKKKIGLFSAADGGTLFLNEIAEISTKLQAKLLQVIEDKKFIPVGGVTPVKCDVRLIVATNRDLEKEIEKERFREDLYYRINVFTINLPPLRERKEDIPIFVKYFLKKYSYRFNREVEKISPEVHEFFLDYSWPGNIRELEATIIKIVVMCEGPVVTLREIERIFSPRNLFLAKKHPLMPFEQAKRDFLNSFEKHYIEDLLLRCKGNISRAARKAQVTRSFIYQKIKQYNIDVSSYRNRSLFVI